jgi:hypothetical protein
MHRRSCKARDNSATEYFKEKTSGRLTEVFKPIVSDSMNSVGVTWQYEDLNTTIMSTHFTTFE